MRLLKYAALASVLALPGCADLSASLTPANVHLGVGLLDHAICAQVGQTDFCTKKEQKVITNAIGSTLLPSQ